MKKPSLVVALTTADNDFQQEQAAAAEEATRRLGADLKIIFADNDSILQSQQLLEIIQSTSSSHPDGILFAPVGGTALPQVARAAAAAGIGWVVLNRDVDYINELRRAYKVPAFSVSSNQDEIGRIQGRQLAALLPKGGSVLYIQGPAESLAAKQRTAGMYETRPADVQIRMMKGQWTEASAYKAVNSWLRLSTAPQTAIDVVMAQNDVMAMGARKAFQELPESIHRDRWVNLPYLGVDGMPRTGQSWVRSGLLAATIVVPPNAGEACEMFVRALQTGVMPPDQTLTVPHSFPAIEQLRQRVKVRSASSGKL